MLGVRELGRAKKFRRCDVIEREVHLGDKSATTSAAAGVAAAAAADGNPNAAGPSTSSSSCSKLFHNKSSS